MTMILMARRAGESQRASEIICTRFVLGRKFDFCFPTCASTRPVGLGSDRGQKEAGACNVGIFVPSPRSWRPNLTRLATSIIKVPGPDGGACKTWMARTSLAMTLPH
jgi:hypothetical protein